MMTKNEPLENLKIRRKKAMEADEAAKTKRHAKGLLTARERVEKLLDPDSFIELDRYALHQCEHFGLENKKVYGDGVITGQGKIDGRPVTFSLTMAPSSVAP